jgi:hypothetical protein
MRHRTSAGRARRLLRALAGVLLATQLLFAGCKSEQELKKEHAKCVHGCVVQHLPGGAGNATVETALRRTAGGGPCMTRCNKLLEKTDLTGKLKSLFD